MNPANPAHLARHRSPCLGCSFTSPASVLTRSLASLPPKTRKVLLPAALTYRKAGTEDARNTELARLSEPCLPRRAEGNQGAPDALDDPEVDSEKPIPPGPRHAHPLPNDCSASLW